MKAIIAFLAGLLLGYLLRRPRKGRIHHTWPVAWVDYDGSADHQPGDMWPPHVTWSYAPPNPGSWN